MREWCNGQQPSTQLNDIVKTFHDNMAPTPPVDGQPEIRSEFRMNFINALLENAYRLLEMIDKDSSWADAYRDGPEAMAQHWLIDRCQTSAASLIEALNKRRKETGNNLETENKALVLLVF